MMKVRSWPRNCATSALRPNLCAPTCGMKRKSRPSSTRSSLVSVLDIAVNNAGTVGTPGSAADVTPESYQAIFDTNVLGVLLCMKYEIRAMLRQGKGSIVNISSSYGKVGGPTAAVYVGSKHAVEGITKSAAIELAGTGVRVNIVGPGPTETGMFNRFAQTEENKANFLEAHIPTKRMGMPEEIANAIVFIGSDKASYIVGASLAVDGGMLAG